MATTLVSLSKFKLALNETGNTHDARYTDALEDASSAVQDYIERDFLSDPVSQERTFTYDGSGVLDIDDASAVHALYLNDSSAELPLDLWTPHAMVRGQSYIWIELPPIDPRRLRSAEMGFTRNEDRLVPLWRHTSNTITVDADWGWNDVPRAVQRATIYVAALMLLDPRGGAAGVASESVAEVARTYIEGEKLAADGAIPGRARELLDPYARR